MALKRLFACLNLFFACALSTTAVAMSCKEAFERLHTQGNVYSCPLSTVDELTPENVLNSYWQRLEDEGTLSEKYLALDTVLCAGELLPWAERRRHLAAACLTGAVEDPSYAIHYDDLSLVQFYASTGIDFTKNRPSTHTIILINLARSFAMAQLLLSYGINPPTTLNAVMTSGFDLALIPFYVEQGTDPQAREIKNLGVGIRCNITPFHQLIDNAEGYKGNRREAVKKAALLKECGADLSTVEFIEQNSCAIITVLRTTQAYLQWKISVESSLEIKNVLIALLQFLEKPQSYHEICTQEFAGSTSIRTAIYKRELGINK